MSYLSSVVSSSSSSSNSNVSCSSPHPRHLCVGNSMCGCMICLAHSAPGNQDDSNNHSKTSSSSSSRSNQPVSNPPLSLSSNSSLSSRVKSSRICLHAVCDGSCSSSRVEGNREDGVCSMIDSIPLACSMIDRTPVVSGSAQHDGCLHRQRRVQSRIESWLVRKPP